MAHYSSLRNHIKDYDSKVGGTAGRRYIYILIAPFMNYEYRMRGDLLTYIWA